MEKMGEFILTLLHAVTNAHLLHLKSESYAEHMALGAFYPALEELTDELAESVQGREQELLDYPNMYYPPMSTALYELMSLSDYVQSMRLDLSQDSEIQNKIDEIQELVNSTVYKLKFLR